MIWFKNAKTEQEWLVSDPDMIARLDANADFERIEKTKPKSKVKAEETSAE